MALLVRFASLATAALLLASCSKKAPVACFTVDKNSLTKANEEIQFNPNCSTDADSYSWAYGDGTTGMGSPVKHKYPNPGTYTVTLTAKNSSKESTTSQTVTIVP